MRLTEIHLPLSLVLSPSRLEVGDFFRREVKIKTIIRHEKLADDGYRYGCEVLSITKKDFHALRRYVLLQQLIMGAVPHSYT
ncbi:hypothetical protein [Aneurinibacillus aneurinilyticus]|uniref:hypothetical protein n=1 Tax=Aneurinibacillus aneurinilyticus TaxID=1391 RepID=UPI0023F835CC|nr:hypothetical protein [Aneurinibacillus aneurinilyticus]MCI1695967.1 hypothetical protein [Aneurinibacillus aneurinilyticus]